VVIKHKYSPSLRYKKDTYNSIWLTSQVSLEPDAAGVSVKQQIPLIDNISVQGRILMWFNGEACYHMPF
jgi:hypothetical protein